MNKPLTLTVSNGRYTISGYSGIQGWLRKPGTATPPSSCPDGSSVNFRPNGGSPIHPNGTLIKEPNVSTVYVLQNGLKRAIASPDVLYSMYENGEFDFGDVITVASDELSIYPSGDVVYGTLPSNGRGQPDGRLIKQVGAAGISIVTNNGMRRGFSGGDIFLKLGYQFCNVIEVADYDSYPEGPPVGAMPLMTASLKLSPSGSYFSGTTLTGSFTITNVGIDPITFNHLWIGGRYKATLSCVAPPGT